MGGQGNVSKMVQQLKEIVNYSESEIYMMLVDCNMDANETVMRLISQDTFQVVRSKRTKKHNTKDLAESSSRGIPNRGARNSTKDSYNTVRGSGNKFNPNETRLAQSVPAYRRANHRAGSSSAPGVRPPPNSDFKNAEVKKAAPVGSTGAATSSSMPAPACQFAWANANPRKKTMAEIVKMGKQPLHQKEVIVPRSSETQESGSKAPLKDEGSSTEKQDVSDPSSSLLKPSAESKTHDDKVSKPSETQESGSKAPLKDDGSSVEKQDVSAPVSSLLKPVVEPKTHADQVSETQLVDESQMDDEVPETAKTNPVAFPPEIDQLVAQCSDLRFGSFGLNDNLEDTQETGEDSSFGHMYNSFQGDNSATDEQASYQMDSTARDDHASSDPEEEAAQHEPPQEDPQVHNFESFFTNVMDPRDASISPLGAGQQASAAAALYQHQALNAYYHQHGMPLGHHGNNFIRYPYMPHGYMHSGFQQEFPVGNHQAPLGVVLPPSAPSHQQQNENSTRDRIQELNLSAAPRGGAYLFRVQPNQPPGFVQAQQYQQQLSQQAAMSLEQLHTHRQHHRQHHHYLHHQQSGGEASNQTQEQLWPNNKN